MTAQHNHVTRDIKPYGQCPGCDVYWSNAKDPNPRVNDREDIARILMLSCSTKMKETTALHYADNLIKAGYSRATVPARESDEWAALVEAASNLGTAAALFQNAKDAFVAKYPKDKQ